MAICFDEYLGIKRTNDEVVGASGGGIAVACTGPGTMAGSISVQRGECEAAEVDNSDGDASDGAEMGFATVADEHEVGDVVEGGKATRCAQDGGGVVERAVAGCETVADVVGCTIGVVTEEVCAGEGTTVRGGAAVRTIRGVADFLERVLILFLEALRGAADDLARASFAALQQTWHLLRAGKPLVLMNRSW